MKSNKVQRQSNIELLRILAMFFVLLVHTCFLSLGRPTHADFLAESSDVFVRILFTSFSVICVNVFVLISGWFGIKPKRKGVLNFLYQILFFFIVTTLIVKYVCGIDVAFFSLVWKTFMQHSSYWFVVAYLVLYALAPVLNAFVERNSRRTTECVLLMLFVCQTIFGWLGNHPYYSSGYSPLSFILLYLLARYVRLFAPKWVQLNKNIYLSVYLLLSVLGALGVFLIGYVSNNDGLMGVVYNKWSSYVSPLNILSALSLLLFFSKLKLQSKIVNFVGASSFSAYLFHCHPLFLESVFKSNVCRIHQIFTPPYWLI